MIKINERYSIEHDGYGWQLHEFYIGVDQKTKEPKRMCKTTYPGRLWVCLQRIVESCGSKAKDVAELKETIERTVAEFKKGVKNL